MDQLESTPQQLIEAFQSLITVIEGEDKHFNEVMEHQRQVEVQTREENITRINGQIETANNQIKDLMTQRDTIAVEVVAMKTKLDTAENSFDGAAKSLESGIQDTLRKLSIYIPTK